MTITNGMYGNSGSPRAPLSLPNLNMDWGFGMNGEGGQIPINTNSLQSMPAVNVGASVGAGAGGGFGSSLSGFGSSIGNWGKNSGFLGGTSADGTQTQGWGMPVIGAIQGLTSAYMGYKALGLEKDKFAQNKKEFDMNWGAQQKTLNSRMSDRQRARVASNSSAYASVDDYMKKNGI